jgi:hypothetical protein
MFWVTLLIWYEYLLETWAVRKESWKEWVRQKLGPSPNIRYVLFANNDIIPSTITHHLSETAMVYDPTQKTIQPVSGTAKLQKLPWLSMQCRVGDEVHDFSDWISEIRSGPLHLLALLRLAAAVHNVYIHEEECKVEVITRQGDEESYRFCGNRYLLKEVLPIRHRDTMPYDTPQKIDPKDSNDCMWMFY